MTGTSDFKQKKNLLYFPDRDQSTPIEGARVVAWDAPMPWYCTAARRLVATVRPGMQLSYSPSGEYVLAYTQDLDPQLYRMRWTCRIFGLDAGGSTLFEFLVDTRALTVHPQTASWAYQIHTGSEVVIKRHLAQIATWERDLAGNGWFHEG